MSLYTLSDLKKVTNKRIQGKIGMLNDANGTMSDAVQTIVNHQMVKLPSLIRVKNIIPFVSGDPLQYLAPTDLNQEAIIDVIKRGESYGRSRGMSLTSPAQFYDSSLGYLMNEVAVDGFNNTKYILFRDSSVNSVYVFDTLDKIGDWVVSGDASGLRIDKGEFKVGEGSLNFDIIAGGAFAGIKKDFTNDLDITEYTLANGEVFVWAWIQDISNTKELTLKIGNDNSNYYSVTETTNYNGEPLVQGANLMSFRLVDMTNITGTPDITKINYLELSWKKEATGFTAQNYRFDNIVFHTGRPYDLKYYTRNAWKDQTTGAEKEIGEKEGDYLNINTDEWDMIKEQAYIVAAQEADIDQNLIDRAEAKLISLINQFRMKNPSQALLKVTTYQQY